MKAAEKLKEESCSIVAIDRFIQATRDSGYKGTASAISELVDNSIQARATRIAITIEEKGQDAAEALEVCVLDDGCGMDPFTLRQALRFGGSTRFGDRKGLGRYGMGLPNASLSQARRVTVYTWQSPASTAKKTRARPGESSVWTYMSYLDVDEIMQSALEDVPRPELMKNPPAACSGASGTLVVWSRCDRLDNRRISTITRKLEGELGRRFRHYIWKGLQITINGQAIAAFDPLYLHPKAAISGGQLFGEEMKYEVACSAEPNATTGIVRVRFSELPVHEWGKLPNEEKRRIGLSKGAGISIVRAGREVDYGWFFMGTKHRENYDDWWRCEIEFEPVLDEAFGITHTKQQVRAQAHLIEALAPDLEAIARALNSRARKAHLAIKAGDRFSEAEKIATERDPSLRPLPKRAGAQAKALMKDLQKKHPLLRGNAKENSRYSIVEGSVKDTTFFGYAYDGSRLVLVLNPDHPFYRDIYKPLADAENPRDQQLRAKLELLLLAAARSEVTMKGKHKLIAKQRLEWSNTLAAYLNSK